MHNIKHFSCSFFLVLLVGSSTLLAQEKYSEEFYDDHATLLATIRQSNGNIIEFYSNPDLKELTVWETGPLDRGAPAFDNLELQNLSMLERYMALVPEDVPIPKDLVSYSLLPQQELEHLLRDRRLVGIVPVDIDINHRFLGDPQAVCSVGSDLDWGPTYRQSGCNAYSGKGATRARARICNKSSTGKIRIALAYKHFPWSNNWQWPNSKKKDIAAGNYGVVAVNSIKRKRRARYSDWEPYYEQATVGGWFQCGYNHISCFNVSHTCGFGELPF